MCYSVKTSLLSYTIGMISGIAALYIREYAVGMLILIYCQVQLAEALIWRGIDTDNIELNRKGTLYAKYTLPAHLLVAGIGFMMIPKTSNISNISKNMPFYVGLLFYIGVILYYTYPSSIKDGKNDLSYPPNLSCIKRECQNNENRLIWPFKDKWYLLQTFLLFFSFLVIFPQYKTFIIIFYFALTYMISKITHQITYSSIWCFISAVLAPILVLSLFLYNKFQVKS